MTNNILIILFGDPRNALPGGLNKYGSVLFDNRMRLNSLGIQPRYIFFGKEYCSNEEYVVLPWSDSTLRTKIRTLASSMQIIYTTDNFKKYVAVGSPLIYMLLLLKPKSSCLLVHHGKVSDELISKLEKKLGCNENSAYYYYSRAKKDLAIRFLKLIEKLSYRYFIMHTAYNHEILNLLKSDPSNSVWMIPNTIDSKYIAKAKSDEMRITKEFQRKHVESESSREIHIIMLSYFTRRKLFHLTHEIVEKFFPVARYRFSIIGGVDSAYEIEFEQAKNKLMAMQNVQVHHLGQIPEEEVSEYLKSASFILHLAKKEGYPLALQEAAVFGCIPIVDDELANGIIPSNLIVRYKDKVKLENMIKLCLQDGQEYKEMKRALSDYACREFAPDRYIKKLASAIENNRIS